MARWWRHFICGLTGRKYFPAVVLDTIQKIITAGESKHLGEICVVIERALPLVDLSKKVSARQRANALFSHLRVWDTERNNGVLIYILLADRAIEIVADRGITATVPQKEWDDICVQMRAAFAEDRFMEGMKTGVIAVQQLLIQHFPDSEKSINEIEDRPVLL